MKTPEHTPAPRRGGVGRTLLAAAATLGCGAATALSIDPTLAGGHAAAVRTLLAPAPGWLTPALAAATVLAALRLLWAMKPARRAAAVTTDRADAAPASAPSASAAEPNAGAGVGDEQEAAPPRRAVSDPSAVFPSYSAAPAPAVAAADGRDVEEDGEVAEGDVLPFPAPTADPAAEAGWAYEEEEGEHGGPAGAPATVRFEDVPASVKIGERLIDLTEVEADDARSAVLKGLTKKEKRTVRKALRDRERLLRRAA